MVPLMHAFSPLATSTAPASVATSSTPPSAGSRLAQVPELLEEILLHLDDGDLDHLRSLLHCQRVSRQFGATIRESPKLSRALFLSPTPGHVLQDTTDNPFLPNRHTNMTVKLGTFTFAIDARPKSDEHGVKDLRVLFDLHRQDSETRTIKAGGSWRAMFLMKCDYMVTQVGHRTMSEEWISPTLGELVDLVFNPMRTEILYSEMLSHQTKAEAKVDLKAFVLGNSRSRMSAAPRRSGWIAQQKRLQQLCSTATVEAFRITRD